MTPRGLALIGALPGLPDTEIALVSARGAEAPAGLPAREVLQALER